MGSVNRRDSGTTFRDDFGFVYEVISHKTNGYDILFHEDSAFQWVIRHPDGRLERFKTESELWQHAIANNYFIDKERNDDLSVFP